MFVKKNQKMNVRTKLVWVGLAGTLIYISAVMLGTDLGATVKLQGLKLNELGDFFAGIFSPLALFWLILGFFLQGAELQQNSEALKMQARELKSAAEQQQRIASAQGLSLENYANSLVPLIRVEAGGTVFEDGVEYLRLHLENLGEYCESVEACVGSGYPFTFGALFYLDKVTMLVSLEGEYEPFSWDIDVRYVTRYGEPGNQHFLLGMFRDDEGFDFNVKKIPFIGLRGYTHSPNGHPV